MKRSRWLTLPVAALVVVPASGTIPPTADRSLEGLSATDAGAIRAAYQANLHAARPVENGYEARNPGQAWNTLFDGRGFCVRPDHGRWTWGLNLVRYGFEGTLVDVTTPQCANAEGGRVAYRWDASLEEWYSNDGRGLEHGYTVARRPPTGDDGGRRLTFTLAVRGDLRPEVTDDRRGVRFLDGDGAVVLNYVGLVVFDADGERLDAGFARAGGELRLTLDERGARYPLTIDPIAQQAYVKASNTGAGDGFGESVSISGNTAVIGASGEDSAATGVNGDQADESVPSSGAAYVFVRVGTEWQQQAYLKASNTGFGDRFGTSVAVSGDTIVVGAHREDSAATGVNGDQADNSMSDAGAAYVFVRDGTTWTQEAYLKSPNSTFGGFAIEGDRFGESVAVSGDTIVVGARNEDSDSNGVNGNPGDNSAVNAGAAYVFVRNGTSWSQQAYLKASNSGSSGSFSPLGDWFGSSVAVSGDTIVVGAHREASGATGVNGNQGDNSVVRAGAAYVFVRNGTSWSQQAYLKASNTGERDRFGRAVAVSGDTIVVGALGEDSNATGVDGDQSDNFLERSGAAYVFARNGTSWSQQAYLKASNTWRGNVFGVAVAVSGETVVVGASREESNATDVNGDQDDDSLIASGAAYVFERNGTSWSQQAYLKASNTGEADVFGLAVAASGDTILIGAPFEDSDATGVNGSQFNSDAPQSGAAYVFVQESGATNVCTAGVNQDGLQSTMSFNGSLALADNDFELCADRLPEESQFGLFVMGDRHVEIPFGSGFLCVDPGGQFQRLGEIVVSPPGTDVVCRTVDFTKPPGDLITTASTWYFQFWYRDFPETNFSDALCVCFAP